MSVNEEIAQNRRIARAPVDMRHGLESVAVDWAGAFYEAYAHLLPHMKSRDEVGAHFVLWSTSPHFAPPNLQRGPRSFSQVLYAMVHDLQVCRVAKTGEIQWAFLK